LAAISMVALLAFAGLAIDVGQLRYVQRQLQSAADASAIAGALELSYCGSTADCSTMQTAAKQAMVENGFSGATLKTQCASTSGSSLSLTVNNGPCALGSATADPNYGNVKFVETVVTKSQPTYFAGVIGLGSVNLSARAEATMGNSPFCFYLTGTSGLTFQENGAALTLSCGLMVDSSSDPSIQANGGTVTATSLETAGTIQNNGATLPATTVSHAAPLPDPLTWVSTPSSGSCTYSSVYQVNTSSATLNPGTYCGGIQVNGGSVTFNPGVYILESLGLQMNGGSMSGTGVTFYLQSGMVQYNGSYSVDLVAPTTGQYAGILFDQSSSDASTAQINGGPGSVFQGAMYFPDAPVQLNGSNVAAYTIVVAKSAQLNGGQFSLGSDYSSLPGGSPAKAVTAVLAE
jgi:Flp pilus assembly protein TadG